MKKFSNVLVAFAFVLVALSGCEKPQNQDPPQQDKPQVEDPICTYIYDDEEYPVYSITSVDNGSQIVVKISPIKEPDDQTTYAVIGINSSLEGKSIDVGRAWSNDDYYFIYETPIMYYSQYRSLQSGEIMIRRLSDDAEYEIIADIVLPDGKNFKFEYEGGCLQH